MAVCYAIIPFVLFDQDYSSLFEDEEKEISDWKDTPEGKILQADILGLEKENINIEIKNYRVLTITGTMKDNMNGKTIESYFMRQVTLPEDVRAKDMTATMDDGVLLIKAPKSPTPKQLVRPLTITAPPNVRAITN